MAIGLRAERLGTITLSDGKWLDLDIAFLLKDYIERRFMRTFQVSGELDEKNDRGEA